MINPYKIKKFMAMFIVGIIPNMIFYGVYMFFGTLAGFLSLVISFILMSIISGFVLKHPFTNMLEGKGILALKMDSTGLLQFFNLEVMPPHMKGKFGNNQIEEIFSRAAVFNMIPSEQKEGQAHVDNNGNWIIKINNNAYNKAKMRTEHYPLVIWNSATRSLITKEFLSDQENTTMANQTILHLKEKMQDLDAHLRDFSRHVVDQLGVKSPFGTTAFKVGIVILIVIVVIMLIIFAPSVVTQLKGAMAVS